MVWRALKGTCGRTCLTIPCADGEVSTTGRGGLAAFLTAGLVSAPDLDAYAVGFRSAALDTGCCVAGFCSVGCCSVVATGAGGVGWFSLVCLNFATIKITTSASATRTGMKEVLRFGSLGA